MMPITTEICNEELEAMHNEQYNQWFEHEELDRFAYTGKSCATWPFPITNGVRNPESTTMLDTKGKLCATIKPDLDNEQDALI